MHMKELGFAIYSCISKKSYNSNLKGGPEEASSSMSTGTSSEELEVEVGRELEEEVLRF